MNWDEVQEWRCPDCGAPVRQYTIDAETIREGVSREDKMVAARGLPPNRFREIVVARHLTLTCKNDHEHYIGELQT